MTISTAKGGMFSLPFISDVNVIKTEQISHSFLQKQYTCYNIKFLPTNHIIKRKFSDFRKLRTILRKLVPYIKLPYLEA